MSSLDPLERDTCRDVIVPSLTASGWDVHGVVEQYPVRAGERAGSGLVDYVLEVDGTPVAVIEAKRESRPATDGLQQALRYARQLDVPLAYATNGSEIIEHNLRLGQERVVEGVAAPPWRGTSTYGPIIWRSREQGSSLNPSTETVAVQLATF